MELEKESQKLYDTLIDSISHEFRTPIAVISGASSVLFDKKIIENHAVVAELANEIYSASQRINLLVENLLDINRLETGQLKLNKTFCSINEILLDIINQLTKEKGNREFKLNFDSSDNLIMIDEGFIRQAFFNILLNSCIYTPDNSIIEVTTKSFSDKFKIEIKDNGSGVQTEQLPKLFDKFYRLPNSKPGGTGLGLSIAKGFIQAHQGKIYAANNIPSGLIFVIELPYDK